MALLGGGNLAHCCYCVVSIFKKHCDLLELTVKLTHLNFLLQHMVTHNIPATSFSFITFLSFHSLFFSIFPSYVSLSAFKNFLRASTGINHCVLLPCGQIPFSLLIALTLTTLASLLCIQPGAHVCSGPTEVEAYVRWRVPGTRSAQ